ncbi:hypothetical protein NDA10_004952 [Ustilago hordei]|nr:hypothetical protein NDA10_004952 [Ustilago hordei]
MGPKVMVTTADPFEEATDSGDGHTGSTETGDPEAMDLSSYQQPMDPDHEEEHNDDDDEETFFHYSASMQVSIGTHNLGVVEASVADTADYDLILGFTELRRLKPTIQWDTGQLEFKTQEQDRPPRRPPEAARAGDLTMRRPTLHGNEFVSAERILRAALEDGPIGFMLLEEPPSSLPAFGFVPTGADKGVEMEVEVDKVVTAADIPKPYQHLRDVFDEVEADKLPHHTEHDLHLELIEGGKPPQGPLYLKGPKEMSELRRYLDENLEKGFIRPSKSPARSPVLFVPKKDGGLRLCVDYRGLNEITVKNRAPLPLIEEQLFLLRKARIYTKLDLRAAYNLIRIAKGDEWKTAFGTQLGLYEYLVMPFGLANAPAHFQSASALRLPPSNKVETDASDFAIAGVLKQEHEGRWHPVAFYSRKMSSAEKNYEIHDKELLAVVACLTQWRHMLAGLPNQLVILTDHEALKYFKSQRRITGRQARWAILLADFDFILQYRPGDKGGEPDALTRRTDMQPASEEQDHNVRQLLPPRVFKETADHDSLLVAPMISMESIASKGLKDLVKIFQPLDQELQEIHRKKPFELKDDLWYSGGRLVIPKVIMPGRIDTQGVPKSIGVSPFFACYGWNPKAHPDIPQRLGVNDPGRFEYLMDGKERCKYPPGQIREAQRRSVDQYNRKHKDIEFKVGDMVYINRRNWKTRRPTPKLDTRFAGPYPVQERVGRRAYRITLPANLRVHDVFHVSMLEPARTSSLPQRAEQPTMPPLPDEDLDFEVEALIDKRSSMGLQKNLNCPDLIQEYEESEGGRVSRQSGERRREQEE